MIENKLTEGEFKAFLQPILRLDDIPTVFESFERVFNQKFENVQKLWDYFNQYNVTFNGFRLQPRDICKNAEQHIHIHFQLRIENKWTHKFLNPNKKVIETIQRVCREEIADLEFKKYQRAILDKDAKYTRWLSYNYFYDANAFTNSSSENGIALSPLIIGTSNTKEYCFIEFNYCALAYKKNDRKVSLKSNWREFMYY